MKISKLLNLHRQATIEPTLQTNLGDGFLLEHNRIYRNVRAQAIQSGAKFSDEPDRDYASLPFSQLERILETKCIPFVDNVSVLANLRESHPDLEWEDLSTGLKRNFIFHESCHLVIRASLVPEPKTENQIAFRMLLEESFANVCELLAVVDAQDAAHRSFYEVNSYTALFGDRANLQKAMKDFGERVVFKFLWLAYLQANYLKMPDESSWQRMMAISEAPNQALKTLKSLAKIAFTLDLDFRTKTTQLHLQLNGLSGPRKLLEYNFISEVETPRYRQLMDQLSRQVLS